MNRFLVAAALAALLAACTDNPSIGHHGPPPHDPADYHGVPTDDRPPLMLDNVPASN